MPIIKDKDCIIRKDGTLICLERKTGKLLSYIKKEISTADVSKEELLELAKLLGKEKTYLNCWAGL